MWSIAQPEFNLKECPIMEETNLDYHMKNSGIFCVIKGSVNGLICHVNEAKELFLGNPALRKYKKLPDFRTKLKDDGHCTYGFGYDDICDDYKAVCLLLAIHVTFKRSISIA
ncbi:putative non-specific lipid-transfer protein 2-like [Capsicum annuum]|nr:putative non-specific lipid-transfer protein 2-like [Capsicum annuum]KAF3636894.1 putative non-specific lipid-transfer protein 2-like [Capsicum annuum]